MHTAEWKDRWVKPVIKHMVPTRWHWIVAYPDKFEMGKFVDIGAFTYFNAHHGITIEDDVEIGSHCAIYSENSIDNTQGRVRIRKSACIGSHTVILPGVTVGEGAKIGAHSLVKSDIPKDTVWAGIPVRKIPLDCE